MSQLCFPQEILTRIYITPSGDLIVTDLWEETQILLDSSEGGFEITHSDL
jgi:hypothetical protein